MRVWHLKEEGLAPMLVPVAQVSGVQAAPVPVVAAIRPPDTGSGGLQEGGNSSLFALGAGLIGLGGLAARRCGVATSRRSSLS